MVAGMRYLCVSFFTQIRSGKQACTGLSHMTHPGHIIYILKTVKINQRSLYTRDIYVDHQTGMWSDLIWSHLIWSHLVRSHLIWPDSMWSVRTTDFEGCLLIGIYPGNWFQSVYNMSSRNEKNVSCGVDDFFTKLIFAKLSVILQEYSNVRTIDFDCSLKAAQTDRMIDRGRTYPPTRSQLVGSLAPLQLFMTCLLYTSDAADE